MEGDEGEQRPQAEEDDAAQQSEAALEGLDQQDGEEHGRGQDRQLAGAERADPAAALQRAEAVADFEGYASDPFSPDRSGSFSGLVPAPAAPPLPPTLAADGRAEERMTAGAADSPPPASGVELRAAKLEVARLRAAPTTAAPAVAAAAGAAKPAAGPAPALERKRVLIMPETTEELVVRAVAPVVAWRRAARWWPAVTTAASARGSA